MKLDKSIAVFAMVASLMLAVGAAAAQTSLQNSNPDQATTSNVQNLSEYTSTSGDTLTLDGGNITAADLQAEQSSDDWAGIYGNASGSISLGQGSAATMYTWSGASAQHVFAVDTDRTGGEPTWSNLDNASAANVSSAYGSLSSPTGASETYNETVTVSFGTFDVTSTAAATTNSNGANDWNTTVLRDDADGTSGPIFHVEARQGSLAFNADQADYQMIVPAPDDSPNAYNMYVELG